MTTTTAAVQAFWERESCGEVYARGADERAAMSAHARTRYALEPFIHDFARFAEGHGRDVLEIGVGMGADHLEWAKARPRRLAGIDLTARAVAWTERRLTAHGYRSELRVADAEALPFRDASFDLVYAWGVLHHTPRTAHAIQEVRRVLRPGGVARIMLYHRASLVGLLLWVRYALFRGRPLTPLAEVYATHLESPGTSAFSITGARHLFRGFYPVTTRIELSGGDLLLGAAGQQYEGRALALLRRFWPRWLIRRTLRPFGLFLLIDARRDHSVP